MMCVWEKDASQACKKVSCLILRNISCCAYCVNEPICATCCPKADSKLSKYKEEINEKMQ